MRLLFLVPFLLVSGLVFPQSSSSDPSFPTHLIEGMEWRSIGPYRGGRSAAVTGVPGKPNLYYMGSTGGGVWKTQDGGQTWVNISDSAFGGSIGAVAVSEYDPNVIYVGGGEVTVRGNVSSGDGIWKSTDAGKSWQHKGLPNSRHIPRIRIHPKNPDLVYAAVLGDLYKSSAERGVYRSKDGGVTWEKILFANEDAGAVDLILDPTNPRTLYASTWRIRRTPYSLSSGGDGSGLWKSTDGGDTWKELTQAKGMPEGTVGIIGVTVSPANPDRVWALIEHKEGGLFRSEDAGATWKKINESRALRQRAWYYTRIYADSQDEDKVYVMNVRYHRSKDGGKTFQKFNAPHGDHHDFWVAPEDPNRMIIGDDGGAQVSYDGGQNWSTYQNQPTAQFYRVTTDNHFPYRIYGAQQDNSAIRIAHRSDGSSITDRDWESTAGGESAHLAIKPNDNDIVAGGSYDGYLTWMNHKTGERRAINVWPDNPMGHGAEGMKYRFQWNFPVFFSPHNPEKLYTASNHLHVTTDMGQTWKIISPDLTRNDPTKLGPSGGPITKDNTAVEYYCTIFAAVESPQEKDLIWVGSDDGLVHLTRDGGENWTNVTPKQLPDWAMINSIEIDPHTKGGAYIAATLYKTGDYRPYLFKTKDYGKSWTKITQGINEEHFTRVLRADPKRSGLLYAGTERGLYISANDGTSWAPFQLNLPIVPITDLALKNDNLIAATQGRSFWILDDLTVLHQLDEAVGKQSNVLFAPMPSYRMKGRQRKPARKVGQNHPGGVMVHFYLEEKPDSAHPVTIEFLGGDGFQIRKFATNSKEKKDSISLKKGFNRFVWDMRYAPAKDFKGMVMWWAGLEGPRVVPGDYQVRVSVGESRMTSDFSILQDPRSSATPSDLQAQFDFLMKINLKITEAHTAIGQIKDARKQIKALNKRLPEDQAALKQQGKGLLKAMKSVEKSLYQTQNKSPQDPLNFPVRLTNKLAHLSELVDIGDFGPTQADEAVRAELTVRIDAELAKLKQLFESDLPNYNQAVRNAEIDAVILKSE